MNSEKPYSVPASAATYEPQVRLSADDYVADEAADAQAAMATALRDLKASFPTGRQWWELAKRHPTASALVVGGVGVGLAAAAWRFAHASNGRAGQVVHVAPERKDGAMKRLARRGATHLQSLIVSSIVAKLVGQSAAEEHVDDVAARSWPEQQG